MPTRRREAPYNNFVVNRANGGLDLINKKSPCFGVRQWQFIIKLKFLPLFQRAKEGVFMENIEKLMWSAVGILVALMEEAARATWPGETDVFWSSWRLSRKAIGKFQVLYCEYSVMVLDPGDKYQSPRYYWSGNQRLLGLLTSDWYQEGPELQQAVEVALDQALYQRSLFKEIPQDAFMRPKFKELLADLRKESAA